MRRHYIPNMWFEHFLATCAPSHGTFPDFCPEAGSRHCRSSPSVLTLIWACAACQWSEVIHMFVVGVDVVSIYTLRTGRMGSSAAYLLLITMLMVILADWLSFFSSFYRASYPPLLTGIDTYTRTHKLIRQVPGFPSHFWPTRVSWFCQPNLSTPVTSRRSRMVSYLPPRERRWWLLRVQQKTDCLWSRYLVCVMCQYSMLS